MSVLDYEFLNNFLIQRENNRNAMPNYRIFLLKLVQGLIGDCLRPDNEPIRVGRKGTNSRIMWAEGNDIGKRDSRTRLLCVKCESAGCKTHSYSICKNCV